MFGRQAMSDVHDTVGAVVLLLILAGIAVRHRANPIAWVKRLGGLVWGLARAGDRFKVDIGPDLRGTPLIPRRLPAAVSSVRVRPGSLGGGRRGRLVLLSGRVAAVRGHRSRTPATWS